MIKQVIYGITGMALVGIFLFFAMHLESERRDLLDTNFVEYTVPSKIIGPASLEFKGLTSDFLLFKFMTFIGGKTALKKSISEKQWESLVSTLDTITDLDPYFWDAYLYSEMFLAWGPRRIEDANRLLLKGTTYLSDNYRLYYYLGFNHYYFLKDHKTASKYFMEAAKRPGCAAYVARLAARLSAYSFQHRDGIIFLKEMLENTRDKAVRDQFVKRIKTLEIMEFLEAKITEYYGLYRVYPKSLDELVAAGMLAQIPEDPYGGKFLIMQNGRVYTTSNMLENKKGKAKK